MANPLEPRLEQECFNARDTTGSQNISVWYSVLPLDASDAHTQTKKHRKKEKQNIVTVLFTYGASTALGSKQHVYRGSFYGTLS